MSGWLRLWSWPQGRFVLAVSIAFGIYQAWLFAAAPGKISRELAGESAKLNVRIELPFAPERFHVQWFQQYGRVAGADDRSVNLRGVKRSDLNTIAKPYWVSGVGPIKEEG
jgi:hypothetical protein